MHQHLFVCQGDRRIIQRLRKEQGQYNAPNRESTKRLDWRDARINADPAVHGLMYELEAQGYPVPEVGADVLGKNSKRIIYSNAELVWSDLREVVVLKRDDECEKLEKSGWTIFTAHDLLAWLNEGR